MGAVWFRLRGELRNRWRSWLGLALLIGIAAGVVLTTVAGARRTDSAWDRLAEAGDAHDATLIGAQFDLDLGAVANLPEVAVAAPLAYVVFSVTPGSAEGAFEFTPLVPSDGRWFTAIDRPKVIAGRRPHPDRADEIAITPPLAESKDLRVGSTFTAHAYGVEQLPQVFGGEIPDPAGPLLTFTVVGIEVAPGEGELLGSVRSQDNAHLSPAFYRTYAGQVAMGDGLNVRLKRGPADLASFKAGVERIAGDRPVQISTQADEGAKIRRSIHLQALALLMFAGLAAVAGLLTVGQALARQTYLDAVDYPALRALGMSLPQLWATAVLRAGVIGTVGAALAVGVALAASPLMPLGLARLADPSPGFAIDAPVLGLGFAAVVVLAIGLTALPAWQAARSAGRPRAAGDATGRRPVLDWLSRAGLPPSAIAGARMAIDPGRGRSAVPTRSAILGAVFSLAALTCALGFGASLDRLFSTPRLYGWNWDVTLGNPFSEDTKDFFVPRLRQSPAVGAFSSVAAAEVDLGGARTQAVGFDAVQGEVLPPIVEGRAPRQPDEVALGTKTLRSIDRKVGDTVDLRVADRVSTVRIVGRGVFPILGTFEIAALGEGALLTTDGLRRIVPEAQENVFPAQLAAGVDHEEAVNALVEQFEFRGVTEPEPPVDVADFGRVDDTPALLSGLLALVATATLAHALITTVRRRRRDLAILKTLGFVRGQVRATVAWQATTMTFIALAVGIPLGIAGGRWAWYLFADGLGIVPEPVVPWLAVLVTIPLALLIANLIAAIPGRLAAKLRPAGVLRAE